MTYFKSTARTPCSPATTPPNFLPLSSSLPPPLLPIIPLILINNDLPSQRDPHCAPLPLISDSSQPVNVRVMAELQSQSLPCPSGGAANCRRNWVRDVMDDNGGKGEGQFRGLIGTLGMLADRICTDVLTVGT